MRSPNCLVCAAACVVAAACSASGPARAPAHPDPSQRQVVLSERAGWRADLVHDQGEVGIWTVKAFDLFPQYGSPELVSLDDQGRALIHVSYSGRWTTKALLADGAWLGGLDLGDVDPRVPGRELYTAGKSGNVYQVVPFPDGGLDQRRIANLGRREVHTLLVADVLPRPGAELLAFTSPGGLYVLAPRADGLDGFETLLHEELGGRVRDALLLPGTEGSASEIATVSRAGALEILTFPGGNPRWTRLHALGQGRGRLALAPDSTPARCVLYTTADDGTIWRHERASGTWRDELVYAGPQGPRGIAAGRFTADPALETLVVCGYGAEVELLARGRDGWTAETIFADRDQGHWITACEVDGRNGTDEIALCGYGGRVVLLSRAAGYGLRGTLARPGPAERDVARPAGPVGAPR